MQNLSSVQSSAIEFAQQFANSKGLLVGNPGCWFIFKELEQALKFHNCYVVYVFGNKCTFYVVP
jgi:hypothetical protein